MLVMEIGEVFYPKGRKEWRSWLEKNHRKKVEIWIRKFRKATGRPSIAYDDLVEEALCFGWIDGIAKKYDEESSVQRITPRRKRSNLSELNRQRIWKLQHLGLITEAGLTPITDQIGSPEDPPEVPDWIEEELKRTPNAWENFCGFPGHYRRLKIYWIADLSGPSRESEKQKRLDHLVKMTSQGKRYGTEPLKGILYD